MTAKRKAISKRTRFAVFARDEFTCRYCGKQPPEVQLVIDHMIPVAEGGDNEETNLITSCWGCNAGKGKTMLETLAPNDQDTARMAQEFMEQKRLAELAADAAYARQRHIQEFVNHLCWLFDVKTVRTKHATRLANLSENYGPERVLKWVDTAFTAARDGGMDNTIKYVNGIARNVSLQETGGGM